MRRLNDGMGRWLTGLRRLICWMGKKQEEGFQNPEAKNGPKTEGERALWQAMGWVEDGWE